MNLDWMCSYPLCRAPLRTGMTVYEVGLERFCQKHVTKVVLRDRDDPWAVTDVPP